jgi:N-acetylmuramoyl-L-alanine amidase
MFKIAEDPGHGGADSGAVGPSGVQEKNITLPVAKMVAEYLAPIAEVMLTRTDDSIPGGNPDTELSFRAKMANDWGADLFVSIHCNAAADPAANGTETYHMPGSQKGATLAGAIQSRLVSALGLRDRGVKQANYAVLRRTSMPAVLVEIAFISNPTEEALLKSSDFQRKAARAIAQGIADYLGIALPEPASAPPTVTIKAGGKIFPAILVDGKTYGPIRAVCEALGHRVTWFEEDRIVKVD